MKKYMWLTVVLLGIVCHVFAQHLTVDEVIAAPSKEIYDLLQDKKGFIWIADELGVRRYDGVTFTSYTHPLQSSLSMTDLVEDKQGRIWCHNFNGQIFYIEHEQMHLLNAYDAAAEKVFPRIALCGNELLATSSKGLFVCNTQTLACKYIATTPHSGTASISIVDNKAILYGDNSWYVYEKGKGIMPLAIDKTIFTGINLENLALQPASANHLVYVIYNPGALLFTFRFLNSQLKLRSVDKCNSFINAVTIEAGEAWVHTKTGSSAIKGKENIKGYNLSCMIKDKDGNTWYGSLEKGLMMSYAHKPWSIVTDSAVKKNDFIKSMKQSDSYLVMGTQQGELLVKDKELKTLRCYILPAGTGAIDAIKLLPKNNFLVSASVGLYLLQPATGSLQCLSNAITVKDITYNDSILYLATPKGLLQAKLDTNINTILSIAYNPMFRRAQRCRAVKYNAATGILWIAYADGLYRWYNNKLETVLYNGEPIYASSLECSDGKVYAGTFSGSLILIQRDVLRRYKLNSAVVRMALCGHHLWIFNAFGLNSFDTDKEAFIYNQYIPYLNGSDVWDATEINQYLYLAAIGQLYKIPVQQETKLSPPSLYLRFLSINNTDTIFDNHVTLTHSQNNLSFFIATPWYNRNSTVTIRYQLTSTNDDNAIQWYELENNERIIQLNALAPGDYRLTIEAGINGNFQPASPVIYKFTITNPWYYQWWFYLLLVVVLAAVLFSLYKYRIRQLLKMERMRREISSNLHDDVGSTVSSINIYSQLIKNGKHHADYIDRIQANTVQVINSLDELVWNINPKYDTMEQLINKMKLFAVPLLSDNHIICRFDAAIEKVNKILPPEVRTDFYLTFKEAVNNIIKHANSTSCDIHIRQAGKLLTMVVKDNGKGFDVTTAALHRNGLTSMQHRAKKLKGSLSIVSIPGEGTQISLSCSIGNTLKIT